MNWIEISNNGQHNDGIFINIDDPSIIMKCGTSINKYVEIINSQVKLFPKQISNCIHNNKSSLIMERLDGDITALYFNIFPDYVLKNMLNINDQTKKDIKNLFNIKIPTTILPIIPINEHNDLLIEISKNIEITLDLYDTFIKQLIILWHEYHKLIVKEIVKIQLKLIELNFNYTDFKFDNFGYKLTDNPLEDDYRKDNVPIILGKYLYVFFIDPESGLIPIYVRQFRITDYINYDKFYETKKKNPKLTIEDYQIFIEDSIIMQDIISDFETYSKKASILECKETIITNLKHGYNYCVHGQYYLNYINKKYITDIEIITDIIKSILLKEYRYDISPIDLLII